MDWMVFYTLAAMNERFSKASAYFFSGVFNPFFIPTFAFLILFNYLPGGELYSFKLKAVLISIVFISTCVLPIAFVLVASLSPGVNRDMMHHKDRILPYIFSAFSIFMGAQLIGKIPVPGIFKLFLLASSLILIALFVITNFWKISGHAAGIGGLLGALLSLTFRYGMDLKWAIVVTIIISGAVGSSRIYLGKHTPSQVYAGFTLSLLIMYLVIYLF